MNNHSSQGQASSSQDASSKHSIQYLLNGPSSSSTSGTLPVPYSSTAENVYKEGELGNNCHNKTSPRSRKHACSFCSSTFLNNSALNRHTRAVHYKERPHTCEYCSRTFTINSNKYVYYFLNLSYLGMFSA